MTGRQTTCVPDCPGPHADGLCYRDADHKPATPKSVEAHVLGGADDGAPTGVAPPGANTGHSSTLPRDVATTLLRALVWCGDQITAEQREQAWAWVEDQRGPVEEMGQ